MKPLPLNRIPSPGWVLPRSVRPSYLMPLANSVGAVRLMDSLPTCAQNIAARFTVVQPASRNAVFSPLLSSAARAAPRPGKARRVVATSISCLHGVHAAARRQGTNFAYWPREHLCDARELRVGVWLIRVAVIRVLYRIPVTVRSLCVPGHHLRRGFPWATPLPFGHAACVLFSAVQPFQIRCECARRADSTPLVIQRSR